LRKLKSGKQVTTYDDLILYLMEKDEGIGKVVLDFEGRNVLLFHLGGITPLIDPLMKELQVVQ
jgi:hypothetical protein